MITKKQIDELLPLPYKEKLAYVRDRHGNIVNPATPIWNGQKWVFGLPPRIKKGKFERGYYVIPKKK